MPSEQKFFLYINANNKTQDQINTISNLFPDMPYISISLTEISNVWREVIKSNVFCQGVGEIYVKDNFKNTDCILFLLTTINEISTKDGEIIPVVFENISGFCYITVAKWFLNPMGAQDQDLLDNSYSGDVKENALFQIDLICCRKGVKCGQCIIDKIKASIYLLYTAFFFLLPDKTLPFVRSVEKQLIQMPQMETLDNRVNIIKNICTIYLESVPGAIGFYVKHNFRGVYDKNGNPYIRKGVYPHFWQLSKFFDSDTHELKERYLTFAYTTFCDVLVEEKVDPDYNKEGIQTDVTYRIQTENSGTAGGSKKIKSKKIKSKKIKSKKRGTLRN